jgi:hypothetical protein
LGELWWTRKKRSLQDLKDVSKSKLEQIQAKKEAKKHRKKARKIQKNMGLIKYYFCPCFRKYYDPALSDYDKLTPEQRAEMDKQLALQRRQAELKIKNPETIHWLKYQEKVEKDIAQLENHKNTISSIQDNPKTNEGKHSSSATTSNANELVLVPLHEKKETELDEEDDRYVDDQPKKSPPKSFLEEKINATAIKREERAMNRKERKQQRMAEVEGPRKKRIS